eukprot:tig00021502_g22054.t1
MTVGRIASSQETDILFLGSIGRKKEHANVNVVEVMGSVCDLSIRGFAASSAIVKQTAPPIKPDDPHKFLVAFDGSVASTKALDLALRFAKEADEVFVYLVTDYLSFSSFFEKRIDELIKQRQRRGLVHVAKKSKKSIADQILDFADAKGPMTFLFLGADGMGKSHSKVDSTGKETPVLGSVADYCIKHSTTPVIVVKATDDYVFKLL